MFFGENLIITELWASKKEYKNSKQKNVLGRGFHSLSLRLSGNVKFEYGNEKFVSTAGHITYMPESTPYDTEVCEGGQMLLVHFKTAQPVKNARPFSIDIRDNKVDDLFFELVRCYHNGKETDYECMSLLYGILSFIKKHQNRPVYRAIPKRMRLAKNFIDKNYNEQIFVYLLADVAGVSEVHFRNEFKKCFGVPPLEYIKTVRINNAKQLLASGYHTVSDVATMCGFDSISYFSYEFKRLTGKSPKEYMNGDE